MEKTQIVAKYKNIIGKHTMLKKLFMYLFLFLL